MSFSFARSRGSRLIIAAAVVAMAVVWEACSKDSTAPVLVVATNTTLNANAAAVHALAGTQFTFAGGAGALSSQVANDDLSLTFGGTETAPTVAMTVTSPTGASVGTFSANVTFGSCIFVVTASSFPAGNALALGQTVTVNPCSMNVGTAGAVANGVSTSRSVALLLGAAASANASVIVAVTADGQLTLNGSSVGTVTLTPASG